MPSRHDFLRAIIDHLPAMVAYWDCRFANRAYESWFGVTPEELDGKHLTELLGPTLYELNRPYVEAALRGEPQEFERDFRNPEGGPPRHGLASYIPDPADDGTVRGFFVLVTDVSAVKRAEAALRESEERFRLTLDEAPIGMALVAPEGRFIRVNRALSEIVGYSAAELTGMTFQIITHPDDLDADLALVERLARGEIPRYHFEKRYVRKDGTIVDAMLSVSLLRGPDGAPRYFISQIEDVTERKRVERELQQTQERLELALLGANLALWDWNVKTGDVVSNARWAELRGYHPDEIRSHVDTCSTGVHPDDWPRVQATLRDCLEGRTAEHETVHRVRTKSGAWRWVLARGKVFARDDDGNPIRMVGTEIDVTERKRWEDDQTFLAEVGTILASTLDFEETLTAIARLAVRRLADCVIVDLVDEAGELRQVLVVHADPTKSHLGEQIKRHRLRGRRPFLGWAALETRRPTLVSEVDDASLRASAQSDEHLRALRELAPRSLITVPLLAREHALGGLVFVSSSPSRRYGAADLALAEELAHRAAMALDNARLYETARRATRLRDEVLGVVAHDLRNPLSAILTQATLLREAPDPARGEAIQRAARRMNRLIQDLLEVTRLEAGRLVLLRTTVRTSALLAEHVEAQRPLATADELTLQLDAPPDLPDVWADRDRLLQVLEPHRQRHQVLEPRRPDHRARRAAQRRGALLRRGHRRGHRLRRVAAPLRPLLAGAARRPPRRRPGAGDREGDRRGPRRPRLRRERARPRDDLLVHDADGRGEPQLASAMSCSSRFTASSSVDIAGPNEKRVY